MLAKFKDQIDAVYAADAVGSAQTEQVSTRRNLLVARSGYVRRRDGAGEEYLRNQFLGCGFPDLDNVDLRLLTRVA